MTDFKALVADIARRINIEYDGGDAFSFQTDKLSVTISSLSELGQKKKRMKPFSR